MKQFTDRYLASIKPQEKKFTVREGRGFALQILPSGIKSFLFIFELNKQKGYMKIGNYPSMSLSDARKAYNDAYNLVKSGVDPREDKKAALEESRRKAEELVQSTAALEKNTFELLMDEGIPENFIPTTVEQLVAVYYVKYSKENHGLKTQQNFLYTVKSGLIPVMGKNSLQKFVVGMPLLLYKMSRHVRQGNQGMFLKQADKFLSMHYFGNGLKLNHFCKSRKLFQRQWQMFVIVSWMTLRYLKFGMPFQNRLHLIL